MGKIRIIPKSLFKFVVSPLVFSPKPYLKTVNFFSANNRFCIGRKNEFQFQSAAEPGMYFCNSIDMYQQLTIYPVKLSGFQLFFQF